MADEDCESEHCSNNVCCTSGDCCLTKMDCLGSDGSTVASCDEESECQGTRGDATCLRFRCRAQDGVDDDSACDSKIKANDCGLYIPVFCNGKASQEEPSCLDSCVDDTACDPNAHCAEGECTLDLPEGGACLLDSECASSHCNKGACCAEGDCCRSAEDCDPTFYSATPTCDDPATCNGTRGVPACEASKCVIARVEDDSGCDRNVIANMCGEGPEVKCQGGMNQKPPPPCATGTCGGFFAAATCNQEAFCWQSQCIPDQPNGEGCTGADSCQSGHCQNNVCCTEGDCCENDDQCPPIRMCTKASTCEGNRQDRHCDTTQGICANTGMPVADDSGCLGQVAGTVCGLNYPATCSAAETQMMPGFCPPCVQTPYCDPPSMLGIGSCGSYQPSMDGTMMVWVSAGSPMYDSEHFVGCLPGADACRPDGICR